MNHSNMESGNITKETLEVAIEEGKKWAEGEPKRIYPPISDYERFKEFSIERLRKMRKEEQK